MMSDTYEKNPKGRGFVYEHDNQLYRRFKQKNNTFDLKCNVQHCDGSARLKNGIFECYTGRVKMQKTVTPSLTWSVDSETDGHGGMVTAALRCGESVGVCSFCAHQAMSSPT